MNAVKKMKLQKRLDHLSEYKNDRSAKIGMKVTMNLWLHVLSRSGFKFFEIPFNDTSVTHAPL